MAQIRMKVLVEWEYDYDPDMYHETQLVHPSKAAEHDENLINECIRMHRGQIAQYIQTFTPVIPRNIHASVAWYNKDVADACTPLVKGALA